MSMMALGTGVCVCIFLVCSKTSYTSRGNSFVRVVERRNPSGCETLKDKSTELYVICVKW
jgi:hypothetical protein